MDGDAEATIDIGSAGNKQTRQRSTISFPYMDLKSAVDLAKAIHDHAGLGECDDDQLAAWTDQSSKSSTFRVQYYAARMFGIIDGDVGRHRLTELGRAILDPDRVRVRVAKSSAFMNVPLYKAVYENYKGGLIPPPAALERDMVKLGVSEKQKDKARQVFERSAEQAGFFEHGKSKLVMPGIAVGREPPREETTPSKRGDNGGNGGGGEGPPPPSVDPIISGLLARLPPTGDIWPEEDRALWLDLLRGSFKLIYKDKPKT